MNNMILYEIPVILLNHNFIDVIWQILSYDHPYQKNRNVLNQYMDEWLF